MKFRQLIKTVDTNNYYISTVNPINLKAQYNPERFHIWKSLHNGPKGEELNMRYSPHYRFLRGHEEAYWKLQKRYGRNNKWIKEKINKFLGICESVKKDGFVKNVSAVEIPLIKNNYNSGLEIFEGHHRVSIALFLGIQVPCEIIRRK